MTFGYTIAQIRVTDVSTYAKSAAVLADLIGKFDGELHLCSCKNATGHDPENRIVAARFRSFSKALDWCQTDDFSAGIMSKNVCITSRQDISEGEFQ